MDDGNQGCFHLYSVVSLPPSYCVALQVREALHSSAIEQKRRQLRSLEAQLAAKRNENATLALHLAGKRQSNS